jgi:hypothetical protein
MKPTILAKHNPEIIVFFHHPHLLWPNALISGKSTAGRKRLQDLNSRLGLPTKVNCRPPSDHLELAVTLCAEKRAGGCTSGLLSGRKGGRLMSKACSIFYSAQTRARQYA